MTAREINADPVGAALLKLGWFLLAGMIGSASIMVGAGIWIGDLRGTTQTRLASLEATRADRNAQLAGIDDRMRLLEQTLAAQTKQLEALATGISDIKTDVRSLATRSEP